MMVPTETDGFRFCDRTGDRPGDLGPEHVLAAPPEKGDMDYSPEGFRKRARIFAIILAAVLLGVPLLAALLLWNRH